MSEENFLIRHCPPQRHCFLGCPAPDSAPAHLQRKTRYICSTNRVIGFNQYLDINTPMAETLVINVVWQVRHSLKGVFDTHVALMCVPVMRHTSLPMVSHCSTDRQLVVVVLDQEI